MGAINSNIVWKATLISVISMTVSLSICLLVVPLLGGTPEEPGLWMSAICPLVIAWPASAYQFIQTEKMKKARDDLHRAHSELDRLHAQLRDAHRALTVKARMDGLTGALNRETFFAELQMACARPGAAAVLLADADHFKKINDQHGHVIGDEALRGIARAISSALGPQDFWGRIGGEEFAIYLSDADRPTAEVVAEHIRLAVSDLKILSNDEPIPVSLSLGGEIFDGPANTENLIVAADRRLYLAKKLGRNHVVFDDLHDKAA